MDNVTTEKDLTLRRDPGLLESAPKFKRELYVKWGLSSWPSYSSWLVPGTEIND